MRFRLYDELFEHFNIVEREVKVNKLSTQMKAIIIKTCETTFEKLVKYYSKIKGKDELLYNFVNVLNFTSKLNLYENWNRNEISNDDDDDENSISYHDKYKDEFTKYFREHYQDARFVSRLTREIEVVEKIMHIDNAFAISLIVL